MKKIRQTAILGIFILMTIQCVRYTLQNKELQEKLAVQISYTEQLEQLTAQQETQIAEGLETSASAAEAINAYEHTIAELRHQISEYTSISEIKLESCFIKKGGVYMIDDERQLLQLDRLIKEGQEIEPGVPAAEKSISHCSIRRKSQN